NGLPGPTNSAGGAGGALWLSAGGVSGSGLIAADGGGGYLPNNGGGGGGRIAIYYTSNSFNGTFSARGGSGSQYGGAGTIYLKQNDKPFANFIVDNGGVRGTNTSLNGLTGALGDVSILGGAMAT